MHLKPLSFEIEWVVANLLLENMTKMKSLDILLYSNQTRIYTTHKYRIYNNNVIYRNVHILSEKDTKRLRNNIKKCFMHLLLNNVFIYLL